MNETVITIEQRRCYNCQGVMYQRGFKRNFLRYMTVFRCSSCRQLFEQETRGFQGFYLGSLLAIVTPVGFGLFVASDLLLLETMVFLMLLIIGSWPIYLNTENYLRAQVLNKGPRKTNLPQNWYNTFVARILCGNSRVRGLLFGVIATFSCALFFAFLFLMISFVFNFFM